ncbi:MAG: PAS domain-containing protein [Candidatus Nanopelagicales bacterium]|nr:PAS domain-containing protein [Candidatus Nanopelagicales bacterium]
MTLLVLDAEGAIRGLNSVAAATVSGTPDDFVNKQIDAPEWMYYHPDGTVMRGEDLPGTRAITTGVCVQDSLLGVRVGRGPMRWVLVTAAAVGDTKGAIIGAVVSFSDLTERRGPDEGLSNRLRGAIDLIGTARSRTSWSATSTTPRSRCWAARSRRWSVTRSRPCTLETAGSELSWTTPRSSPPAGVPNG